MARLIFGDKASMETLEYLKRVEHEALTHQIECPWCRIKKHVAICPYNEQLRMTQPKLICKTCKHEFWVGKE